MLISLKGEQFALLITEGFKDLLHIGNQSRPDIFDLSMKSPQVLFDKVIEIEERITLVQETGVDTFKCQTGK